MRRLQAAVGNRAVGRLLARDPLDEPAMIPFRTTAVSRPAPQWHERRQRGRRADPEQPTGPLPFTTTGWDGAQIARRMSQLNVAAARTDEYSCVETSFLAEVVQRGPGAVRRLIAEYVADYERQITSRTPRARLRILNRGIQTLRDVDRSISAQTATYGDLSRLLANLFMVHGRVSIQGTSDQEETAMASRSGYRRTALNLRAVTRERAAAEAATLHNGEYLSCGIDASSRGTGRSSHAIHIRRGDDGTLYRYDPWPLRGAQQVVLGADLAEMSEYFVGQWHGHTVQRTFEIVARFTPTP